MQLLHSTPRAYSWGSRTLIPELLGEETSEHPVAELWFGAHPAAPSTVGGRALDEVIAQQPAAQLGERVEGEYSSQLPFLLKILAAAEPLSLQAHPTKEQAEEGFERDNAAGLSLTAPERNYRDNNHKPELIVALTDFYAMVGFRPLAETRKLFAALNSPELDRYLSMLSEGEEEDAENYRALFTTWITIPAHSRKELIAAVIQAGEKLVAEAEDGDWKAGVMSTVIDINEQYPGDIGVLGALLLNHITLQPGEAVYLDAGQLHAYVSGLGVEIMANSDNVLRGGLTSKYVDVPELVKVLSFAAIDNPRVSQLEVNEAPSISGGSAWAYPVPIGEFAITRCDLEAKGTVDVDYDGPTIVLCTDGEVVLSNGQDEDIALTPGRAAWLPASDPRTRVTVPAGGALAQVFLARA